MKYVSLEHLFLVQFSFWSPTPLLAVIILTLLPHPKPTSSELISWEEGFRKQMKSGVPSKLAVPAQSLNLAWSGSCHAGALFFWKDSKYAEKQLEGEHGPRPQGTKVVKRQPLGRLSWHFWPLWRESVLKGTASSFLSCWLTASSDARDLKRPLFWQWEAGAQTAYFFPFPLPTVCPTLMCSLSSVEGRWALFSRPPPLLPPPPQSKGSLVTKAKEQSSSHTTTN